MTTIGIALRQTPEIEVIAIYHDDQIRWSFEGGNDSLDLGHFSARFMTHA